MHFWGFLYRFGTPLGILNLVLRERVYLLDLLIPNSSNFFNRILLVALLDLWKMASLEVYSRQVPYLVLDRFLLIHDCYYLRAIATQIERVCLPGSLRVLIACKHDTQGHVLSLIGGLFNTLCRCVVVENAGIMTDGLAWFTARRLLLRLDESLIDSLGSHMKFLGACCRAFLQLVNRVILQSFLELEPHFSYGHCGARGYFIGDQFGTLTLYLFSECSESAVLGQLRLLNLVL